MSETTQRTPLFKSAVLAGTLRTFLPGLLLLMIGLTLYYLYALKQETDALKHTEQLQMQQLKQSLLKDLNTAIKDLVILSELQAILELNSENHDHALQHLQQHFLSLSANRRLYDQIRYLDQQGKEVVRVNYNRGAPQPVHKTQLQHKGKRYYFNDSFILKRHQIFISPLDLNIEKGQIEQPHKPMIRLGMPVFNAQDEKIGVVLLNYFAQQLLDTINQLSQAQDSDAMLLNADGYWLSHPQPERRWGFMFKREETMDRYHPLEWAQIRHIDSGQIENEAGIFTYDTLYPLGEEMFSSSDIIDSYGKSEQIPFSKTYFWKVVTHVNNRTLQQRSQHLLFYVATHGTLLLLVLLIASWWRAYTRYNSQLTTLALEEQHRRHTATVSSAIDAIITTNAHGEIIEFNPSADKMFGFGDHPVTGRDVADIIIPAEYRSKHHQGLKLSNQDQLYSGKGRFEAVAHTLQGRRFPIEITIVRTKQQNQHIYTTFLRDISERKAHEESIRSAKRQLERRVNQRTEELVKINQNLQQQIVERVRTEERLKIAQEELERSNRKLEEHAAKDSLTGLANRRAFDARITEEWQRNRRSQQPIALILFDIDFFKRFNDNYGHLAGDECLRTIGQQLQQSNHAQRPADMVARYGGEEFVVILSGSNLEHASSIGEEIRFEIESLKIPHEFRNDQLQPVVTISLGVAVLIPNRENTPEMLVALADKALYAAKSQGRNRLLNSEEAASLQ